MNNKTHPETKLAVLLGTLIGLMGIATLALGAWRAAPAVGPLQYIQADAAEALETLFGELGYDWPPGAVPPLALAALPADMDRLHIERRKALFLRALLPLVLAENRRVREQRAFLEAWLANPQALFPVGARERARRLAAHYGLPEALDTPDGQLELLARVDEIPPALALAQAALESGWGTSRFAREGNSLFGQWTFQPEAGLIPGSRRAGATHAVRSFPDLAASVTAYFHNLNTGGAYAPMRRLRAELREQGAPLDPVLLADGLVFYSERRWAYVRQLKSMIRTNELAERLLDARLAEQGAL